MFQSVAAVILDESGTRFDSLCAFLNIRQPDKKPIFFYSRLVALQPTSEMVDPTLIIDPKLADPTLPAQIMLWGQSTTPDGEVIDPRLKPILYTSQGILPVEGLRKIQEQARNRMRDPRIRKL